MMRHLRRANEVAKRAVQFYFIFFLIMQYFIRAVQHFFVIFSTIFLDAYER
jgi:hypothetical protein